MIRVDPAPAFVSLKHDPELTKYIDLEIGHPKNVNKNPVAERAIQELGMEILHLEPEGGPITPLTLAQATASLNARIRHGGLSAREIWTQRDQITLEQLPINDRKLIVSQHHARIANHKASSISKSHNHGPLPDPELSVGDLVYLLNDRDKHSARNKYLVVGLSDDSCEVRKFTKSQFRTKSYTVPTSNCYKVSPNPLVHKFTGPIRDMDSDSEEDNDIEYPTPQEVASLDQPVAPPEIVQAPQDEPNQEPRWPKGTKPPEWLAPETWVLTQ